MVRCYSYPPVIKHDNGDQWGIPIFLVESAMNGHQWGDFHDFPLGEITGEYAELVDW